MITLSKSGNTIVFEFDENSGYLQNGTIEVPLNSLSLVIDESDMATFKKSATNDIFVSARYEDFGKTKAELESWYEENMVGSTGGGGGVDSGTVQTMIDKSISEKADSSAVTEEISAAVSGKVDTVYFNVYSAATSQILNTKVDNDRYTAYTAATSQLLNTKADSSAVTEEISAAVSGKVDTVFFNVYSAATSQLLNTKVDNDTYTAYTAATEAVLSGKQDTLSAGTNITIVDNVISATGGGGGKAIEGGRGITVTTGATADTVEFNLPISAGTGSDSIIGIANNKVSSIKSAAFGSSNTISGSTNRHNFAEGSSNIIGQYSDDSHAEGFFNKISGYTTVSHVEGCNNVLNSTSSNGPDGIEVYYGFKASHAEGAGNVSNANGVHLEGYYNTAKNFGEHASGTYNNSVSASTTFGNSGNTLFSVGNGTADNARHNAFEIRQNGDIYLSSGGTDIKLQDYLGGGGGSITIDPSLDSGSTNAVANSAITTAIDGKANKATAGRGLMYGDQVTHNAISLINQNDQEITGYYYTLGISKINGKAIVNQGGSNPNTFSLVETSAITTSVTSASTDVQVPSAKAVNDKLGGLSLVKLTQAEYDALVSGGTVDANTLYIITNVVS